MARLPVLGATQGLGRAGGALRMNVEPRPGDRRTIGHYRLIQRLGTGGMGEVHLAEDLKLRRKVAIKLLHAWNIDTDRSLLTEARTVATLDHPNICSVYEVGEDGPQTFIVMQYVEGELLSDRLRRGPLDVREALEIAMQVADGLGEAHERGIVHRDVKPANIIIAERGLVKVLDFGIAKDLTVEGGSDAMEITRAVTQAGALVGTVPYMSPEQLNGKPIDPRSDVFAFSVMLYEMLTGHHPFKRGTDFESIAEILTGSPPPLDEVGAKTPQDLQHILDKGLSKNPEERYADARDMLHDLRLIAEGHTGVIRPPRAPAGLAGLLQSRWVRAAGLATAVVAGAFLAPIVRSSGGTGVTAALGSIAVLPLVNLTGDPDTDYLADGLTESLINDLSRVADLRVVSRFSAFQYRGPNIDPLLAATELNVGRIVTGRIQQGPRGLQISLELTGVAEDRQLWGGDYPADANRLSATRSQVSAALLQNLGLDPGDVQQQMAAVGRETQESEAYRLLLRGNFNYYTFTLESVSRAIDFYSQAIERDSSYALAYALRARAYSLLAGNYVPSSQVVDEWKASAERALELDPDLADAHYARALVLYRYDWDWAAAQASFLRALELNANLSDAHTAYGMLLCNVGRLEDADRQFEMALALDPLSLYHNSSRALCRFYSRDFETARDWYEITLELDPEPVAVNVAYAKTLSHLGLHDEALAALAVVGDPGTADNRVLAGYAYVYARAGRLEEARAVVERMAGADASRINDMDMTHAYGIVGDVETAIRWLQKAHAQRHPYMITLAVDPKFDPLRNDPRFRQILADMRFPQ